MNIEKPEPGIDRWFALRVKSRQEKLVAKAIASRGFEEFLPTYQRRCRWSDRVKSVDVPLFPGYVFCRLDPRRRLSLLVIPGVSHFVGIGKIPVPIEDSEMAAIQEAVRSGLSYEPWPFLQMGQRISMGDGPLAGIEGIYIGDSKQERIVVSITLLQRSVAVSIERQWVRLVDGSRWPGPVRSSQSSFPNSSCT
jgi:transcription antitermination factor NusG